LKLNNREFFKNLKIDIEGRLKIRTGPFLTQNMDQFFFEKFPKSKYAKIQTTFKTKNKKLYQIFTFSVFFDEIDLHFYLRSISGNRNQRYLKVEIIDGLAKKILTVNHVRIHLHKFL
jgi:hypothetical protein